VNHDADTTIHLAEILGGAPYRRAYYCTVLRDGRPTRLEYTENNHCCQRFERGTDTPGRWLRLCHLGRTAGPWQR
jgi:aminoglycoside N3'-acetyltransferase